MNGGDGKPGWRSAPGWMKALLVVSLGVNVTVAGLVGGNALREWSDPPFAAVKAEPGLDRRQTRILRMVPEERQDQARAILLDRQDELDQARRQMWEAHMAFIEAIRQDPLDPRRLEAALDSRNEASGAFWRIGMEQVTEIARSLPAGQRAELADRLEERTRRWMKRWGEKKDR